MWSCLEMWQMGSENMMQWGSHKGGVSMDVTHQLGQKEVTLNTGFVTLRKGNPQGSKGGGSGSINVVDLVEPKDCPVISGGIGLWL